MIAPKFRKNKMVLFPMHVCEDVRRMRMHQGSIKSSESETRATLQEACKNRCKEDR